MTREEAQTQYETATSNEWDFEEMIDKIYDDFESRTCDNCDKYGIIKADNRRTFEDKEWCYKLCRVVTKDFGCNKFERKHNA